eukprot:scaffold4174_cov122-Isochrysis_galbana.AAC.7
MWWGTRNGGGQGERGGWRWRARGGGGQRCGRGVGPELKSARRASGGKGRLPHWSICGAYRCLGHVEPAGARPEIVEVELGLALAPAMHLLHLVALWHLVVWVGHWCSAQEYGRGGVGRGQVVGGWQGAGRGQWDGRRLAPPDHSPHTRATSAPLRVPTPAY